MTTPLSLIEHTNDRTSLPAGLNLTCSLQIDPAQATPMMQQFLGVKHAHPGVVVFYRMGDFYETFFEDALITSKALEITLTARDAGALGKVPMAGVPVRAVDAYLQRLLAKNFKVAICEQVQDPKEAKGLVERRVTRLLSKGTITELGFLSPKQNNYLAALSCLTGSNGIWGLAYCDVSTGQFEVIEQPYSEILNTLDRISPSELLVPGEKIKGVIAAEWVSTVPAEITDNYQCTVYKCEKSDKKQFNQKETTICRWFSVPTLSTFGLENQTESVFAVAAILEYLEGTYIETARPKFESIKKLSHGQCLEMTPSTRHHLELTHTARGFEADGSLLALLDKTVTPMGGRSLRQWVLQPSSDVNEINARLDTVEAIIQGQTQVRLIDNLQRALESVYDLERLATKLSNQTIMPRELLAIQQACQALPVIAQLVSSYHSAFYLSQLMSIPDEIITVGKNIKASLLQDAPVSIKEGAIFTPDYHPDIARLRHVLETQDSWQQSYEQSEREKTGLKNLKVGFNNAFGYFIEISKAQAKEAPVAYHRKQTLTNCERFITPELKEHESAVFEAQNNLAGIEYNLFCDYRDSLLYVAPVLKEYARRLAVLDILTGFASLSLQQNYCRPTIDESTELDIRDCRHPVLEQKLPLGQFVPNDCILSSDTLKPEVPQLLIITGPNMAGKSTYMRQVALCIILGQMGCYVPASYCSFGVVDNLYARIGASDDLNRGQSTFMVEMIETAEILNCATPRSFVIFDEVGRGTSTYDGISIAWSVVEYIVKSTGARTMFATHYHELNTLEVMHPKIKNVRVTVSETEGDIHFLYRVASGAAQKSYGIQVARMSGMPSTVVQLAEKLLNKLQEKDLTLSDQKREKLLKRYASEEGQLQLTL